MLYEKVWDFMLVLMMVAGSWDIHFHQRKLA
jgi:hypothetical protein